MTENIEHGKRYFIWQSNYLSGAALLTFSAFIGTISLQSSVNIAEELGTTSLAITYGTNMLCNLTFTTFIIKRLGRKLSLIVADVLYILYTLSNLYPVSGLLLTAAFLLGVAQAIVWCVFPLFNTFFGEEYSKLVAIESAKQNKMAKSFGAYIRRFVGRFYTIFSAYLIIGNFSSFVILYFDETHDVTTSNSGNTSTSFNNIFSNSTNTNEDFLFCGANQCSASRILSTEESNPEIENYFIQNWTLKLILFIFFAFLQIAALLIHIFLLKETNSDNVPKKVTLLETVNVDDVDQPKEIDDNNTQSKTSWGKDIVRSTFRLLRHLIDPQRMLIIPFNIQFGFAMAFIFGDFTRSFISCISGVQKVGLVMVVFGVCEIVGGLVIERLSAKLGRCLFLTISYVLELGNFLFCLFWSPSETNWIPYLMAIFFGLSDGLRQPLLSATVMEYFDREREIAYSTTALLSGLGSCLIYFFSRFLCVKEKLYLLIATSLLSAICLIFAEKRFRKNKLR